MPSSSDSRRDVGPAVCGRQNAIEAMVVVALGYLRGVGCVTGATEQDDTVVSFWVPSVAAVTRALQDS